MANLQVKDIDDYLYESIRELANHEKRSISQEVVMILQKYLSNPKAFEKNPTDEFLSLSGNWIEEKNSDQIINEIYENRKSKTRFGDSDGIFD
jgi:plasmid stability protein